MRITKHISFFYIENRILYVNKILDETNKYELVTDVFIHTNNDGLTKEAFNDYSNGSLSIIYHDLSNIHPFYLTWKCRELLKEQKDRYDIFIYTEDDMLIPYNAIKYWLKYNRQLIDHNYNLGFLRIEVENNNEYVTDLPRKKFSSTMELDGERYCINNINPYCAMWIYNKDEFNNFVDSKYYDIKNIPGYEIRERSAIGLHGASNYWYKGTLIPIINNKLISDCRIYHMPNNYVINKRNHWATILFDDSLQL